MHLTGQAAQAVDQQAQQSKTQTLTDILSVLFIILLLFLTFRALLAPIVALLPSAVALIAVQPVIAASSHLGVQVSDLTPVLLVVVMLGAGTDYGLFLIFRVREEIRRGRTPHEAVAFSLAKVGESITFSGLTVMAALATVVIATFGLYKGFGPALAIGIGMALLANLTLLPALLAIFGTDRLLAARPGAGRGEARVLGSGGRTGRGPSRADPRARRRLLRRTGLVHAGLLAHRLREPDAAGQFRLGPGPGAAHRPLPGGRVGPDDRPLPPRRVRSGTNPTVLATAGAGLRASGQFSSVDRRARPERHLGDAGRAGRPPSATGRTRAAPPTCP